MIITFFIKLLFHCSEEPERKVEPLRPPEGSKPGDKIVVEGYESGTADDVLNPKKKVWDKLQVNYRLSALQNNQFCDFSRNLILKNDF